MALPNYFYHFKCRLEIRRVFSETQKEFEEKEIECFKSGTLWDRAGPGNSGLEVRTCKETSHAYLSEGYPVASGGPEKAPTLCRPPAHLPLSVPFMQSDSLGYSLAFNVGENAHCSL